MLPVVLGPVRAFLASHAAAQVQVVLLPEVVAGTSLLARGALVATRGLTFRRGDDLELDSVLPPSGPLVLIGTDIPAHRGALTLAHELGHALGLAHDPRPANLMYDGSPECVPWVDATQLSAVAVALAAFE